MENKPILIEDTNLSNAWRRTVEHITKHTGNEITPLVLSLSEFDENIQARELLNLQLVKNGMFTVETVSETIFPESLYQYCKKGKLYQLYKRSLPRIKKIERQNRRGTYFERLIDYNGKVNQLDVVIDSVRKNRSVRRSKLQASIFDPNKDHIESARQGFPCMQHLTFAISQKNGLILNSFYAMQYLYARAYGNWLGLINLGHFMADQIDVKLEQFNCFVGVEKLDMSKDAAKTLVDSIISNSNANNT
jgi:thymidylate synthase